VLIAQAELTPERLAEFIRGSTRERLRGLAIAARRVGRADAAERVAAACVAEAERS
jgi:UDP-N-acetylglucosamine:LPS N-acetylglucosamine transferase